MIIYLSTKNTLRLMNLKYTSMRVGSRVLVKKGEMILNKTQQRALYCILLNKFR